MFHLKTRAYLTQFTSLFALSPGTRAASPRKIFILLYGTGAKRLFHTTE